MLERLSAVMHLRHPSALPSGSLRAVSVLLLMVSCAATQRGQPADVRPLPAADVVAPWERVIDGACENRGIAQVERLGTQWLLNVMCDGTHATYIEESSADLSVFTKGYVHARYRYVERTTADVKCIKEPCPPVADRRASERSS